MWQARFVRSRKSRTTMAKGKVPSLLTGNAGTPVKVKAIRTRKCSRCRGSIAPGCVCAEVPKPQINAGRRTYCLSCFQEVVDQTRSDLDQVIRDFWPCT